MAPRIKEVRIRGLRALEDVIVPLDGLTVLIGDNGTGKSSVLEALRILSFVATGNFMATLSREHTLKGALHPDDNSLYIQIRIEDAHYNLLYGLRLEDDAQGIAAEHFFRLPPTTDLSTRTPTPASYEWSLARHRGGITGDGHDFELKHVRADVSVFEYLGRGSPFDEVNLVREALEGIDSHIPFEVSASWAMRASGRRSAMREPALLEPSGRLSRFGANLANVYNTLKNSGSERWRDTLELLQLGVGPHLQDVLLGAAAGGHLNLSLELAGVGHVPAYQLSDGQLSFMAFVALAQLDEGRTLLSFDEPEQHLHPALLGRVVQLLEGASERYPVLLATHSDRLLDFLPDPVAAVRVCELDGQQRTVLRELDQGQLDKWLTRYRGVGELRAAGQLRSVLAQAPTREGSAA